MNFKIPHEIENVMLEIENAGYSVYIVGGAVRDMFLRKPVKDYDLATSATPYDLLRIFGQRAELVSATFCHVVYVETEIGARVEVATFREEGEYSDGRRPDSVSYTDSITTDLYRRDATINAIALDLHGNIVDPTGGIEDLKRGMIKSVGDPEKRISEHPIRMMRYIRFASMGGFWLDSKLASSIRVMSRHITSVPNEAAGIEFMKGLDGPFPGDYIAMLDSHSIFLYFMEPISAMVHQGQNIYHGFSTVFDHTLDALDAARFMDFGSLVMLAVLLHDIGKPSTAEFVSDEYGYSFIGHEKAGARIAEEICEYLHIPKNDTDTVVCAVRNHMLKVTSPKSARKMLAASGDIETALFTICVQAADKGARDLSTGYAYLSEAAEYVTLAEFLRTEAPFSVKDLAVDGYDIMEHSGLGEGPEIGKILRHLLDAVMEDRVENKKGALFEYYDTQRAKYF